MAVVRTDSETGVPGFGEMVCFRAHGHNHVPDMLGAIILGDFGLFLGVHILKLHAGIKMWYSVMRSSNARRASSKSERHLRRSSSHR